MSHINGTVLREKCDTLFDELDRVHQFRLIEWEDPLNPQQFPLAEFLRERPDPLLLPHPKQTWTLFNLVPYADEKRWWSQLMTHFPMATSEAERVAMRALLDGNTSGEVPGLVGWRYHGFEQY